MFLRRSLTADITADLAEYPAVGILGPRQVGKTTLAKQYAATLPPDSVEYLDLQSPSARLRLTDAESYFLERPERLVIVDRVRRSEMSVKPVHRAPRPFENASCIRFVAGHGKYRVNGSIPWCDPALRRFRAAIRRPRFYSM